MNKEIERTKVADLSIKVNEINPLLFCHLQAFAFRKIRAVEAVVLSTASDPRETFYILLLQLKEVSNLIKVSELFEQ